MRRYLWVFVLPALLLFNGLVPRESATSTFAASTYSSLAKGKVCHYKVVVKKVNGKKKHVAVKVCHAAKTKPTATPEPTATDTPANTPAPVTITGFDIYAGGITSGCQSNGAPASIFPASVPEIFIQVHALNWIGPHEAKMQITDPNGKVYYSVGPTTFSDTSGTCSLVAIARNGIANQGGTWSIVFYLDGVQAGSTTFTLTAVTPAATPLPLPPTASPAPRIVVSNDAAKGIDTIIDTHTGVGAALDAFEHGTTDSYQTNPKFGVFEWALALEDNEGTAPYISSYFNFHLVSPDGVVYDSSVGTPPDKGGDSIPVNTITTGEKNAGWIEYDVPRGSCYYYEWNENRAIPDYAFAKICETSTGLKIQTLYASPASLTANPRLARIIAKLEHRVLLVRTQRTKQSDVYWSDIENLFAD